MLIVGKSAAYKVLRYSDSTHERFASIKSPKTKLGSRTFASVKQSPLSILAYRQKGCEENDQINLGK